MTSQDSAVSRAANENLGVEPEAMSSASGGSSSAASQPQASQASSAVTRTGSSASPATSGARKCAVKGCARGGRLRRGWCDTHYERWYASTPNGKAARRAYMRRCKEQARATSALQTAGFDPYTAVKLANAGYTVLGYVNSERLSGSVAVWDQEGTG